MLRSGLILLFTSTVGVTLRSFELVDPAGVLFKIVCSLTSIAAVVCFLGTYYSIELAHSKNHIRK